MFTIIFAFTFIVTNYVAAKTPAYVHICKSRDAKFDQCVIDNIIRLKDQFCEGIPELNIPSKDPFFYDNIVVSDTPNSKIILRNVRMTGHCEINITDFNKDLDKLHFEFKFLYPRICMNGTFDIDIHLLLVPFVYKGSIYITNNLTTKISTDMKVIAKNGKKYVYISKMKANIDIFSYRYDIVHGTNEMEMNRIDQIINNFVGNNQEEIINILKPMLEESFVKQSLPIINTVLKQYTFEELFPDRV